MSIPCPSAVQTMSVFEGYSITKEPIPARVKSTVPLST